jgi:enamine deaminase RidA (YjgF/YER057c/UK114 family)
LAGDNPAAGDPIRRTGDQPPSPQGEYVAATSHGSLAMSAGMTPRVDGELVVVGRVGEEVTIEEASHAAGLAAGNALAALAAELGGLHRIDTCLRMTVYIACGADFTSHSAVADGASVEILDRLGSGSLPSRAAVGVISLPGGSPVEVELTVAVRN